MSIYEIIEFIKSNPEIEIKISSFEEYDGYFQLSSDAEAGANIGWKLEDDIKEDIVWQNSGTTSLENLKDEWLPNMKKPLYQDCYFEWDEGIIEHKSFLEHLNQFVEQDDENGSECNINDFIEYMQECCGRDPDNVRDEFNLKDDLTGGIGREVGVDDEFSWYFSDYVEDAEINISGYLNNKKVF